MVHTPMQGLSTARNGESIASSTRCAAEWRKKKAASTRVDAAWVDPMSRVIPVMACSRCCVAEPESLDPRFRGDDRSEEHTSELQSLMRISYAVFCLKTKKNKI